MLEGYKNVCEEIVFIPGTEKFAECVLEVIKKRLACNTCFLVSDTLEYLKTNI